MWPHSRPRVAAQTRVAPIDPPTWPLPSCMRRLSPLYPETLMLGLELRDKVAEYVRERIGGRLGGGCRGTREGPREAQSEGCVAKGGGSEL